MIFVGIRIGRSKVISPNSEIIKSTIAQVYESPATMLRKEKARNLSSYREALKVLTAPEDNIELLDIVALLFEDASNDSDVSDVKEYHKKFYKIAETRFVGNEELLRKLKAFKIKRFGLF